MATPNPYFLYPFGGAGSPSDLTAIENQGGTTGPLSYQYGFTPNYEEDLSTIPSALPIPRPQFNQLMLDITAALQQLQLQGAPLWVAPAIPPAQGGPSSYPLYARVSYTAGPPYGLQIWESQVINNTSVPGANNDWLVVSGGRGIAAGTYIDSASPRGYPGALLCNGAAYARASYPLLFQALTYTASCTTNSTAVVSVPTDVIALMSAYLPTSGNSTPCFVEASNIAVGTYITAIGSTTITLSANASSSGTFTLTFLPYGYGVGGDATTFGVPNCLRRVSMAAGGSGNTVIGNKLGNTGGDDTYLMLLTDMVNHTHNYIAALTPGFSGFQQTEVGGLINLLTASQAMNGRAPAGGDQTKINIIQQSQIVFRYIKY